MTDHPSQLLRTALKANAIFSALAASVLLIADGMVAALLGTYDALGTIHFVGLHLAVFAGSLFWLMRSDNIARPIVIAVIAADLLWVAASWVAIGSGTTSGQGSWAVGIVADIVLLLAIVQYVGLRRLQPS